MKIITFVSTALAFAAFACVTPVNSSAENADKTAAEKDQHVYLLSELSSRPVPTKQADPDVRDFNRQDEHFALVSLIIESDGAVVEAELEKSSSPQFGKAAVKAVKQWQFTPAMRGGKAVRTRVSIPFRMGRKS